MDIGIIAVVIMAAFGILMVFAPKICTSSDKRDDSDAVSQVKKLGGMFIVGAVGAALLMLKYKLR